MRADSLMAIGRIPVIDSVVSDTADRGDTVDVYGSDWLQQKGTGWIRIDSATAQKDMDTASWDSVQISAIIPASAFDGSHSIQVFNSDSFGDTVPIFIASSCTIPTITRHATGICTVGVAVSWDHAQTGTVDSVTISPALPSGLSLAKTGANIGRISGTPLAASPKTAYVLTAWGCSGSGTTNPGDTITVILLPPGTMAYVTGNLRDTVGTAQTRDSLVVTGGGAIDSFRISPALPAGLALDSTTGAISGTPTRRSIDSLGYTVTAYNSAGTATTTIGIKIVSMIDSIRPVSGRVGSVFTVYGVNFGETAGSFWLNGIDCGFPKTWTPTGGSDTVPAGSPRGYYSPKVVPNGGAYRDSSRYGFRVKAPAITGGE